jgi:hypothetical protein
MPDSPDKQSSISVNNLPLPNLSLEERVARLEGKLGWKFLPSPSLSGKMILLSFSVMCAAIICSYKGLGLPNHYYQVALAVLITVVLYHTRLLVKPRPWLGYALPLLNAAVLGFILKLFIGTGTRYPLGWLMYPGIRREAGSSGSWKDYVPSWSLEWIPGPMATWSIDITIVQTFLLLLTIMAALFGFQPFASMVALVLVLFSIPALVSFSWPWVFPAIVLAVIGLYLQSRKFNQGS